MVRIGILELQTHESFLHTMAKLMETTGSLTIFTSSKIYNRVDWDQEDIKKYRFVLKKENENSLAYFQRVKRYLAEQDLLIVNTIPSPNPPFWIFNPECKKVLVLHNINKWLKRGATIYGNEVNTIRDVYLFIYNNLSLYFRDLLLSKYDAYGVLYEPQKTYIEKVLNRNEKKTFVFPFSYNIKPIETETVYPISFVVPGSLNNIRKDYELLYDVFSHILEKYQHKTELVLLGGPEGIDGNKIYNDFKEFQRKGCNIKLFPKRVPEKLWSKYYQKGDISLLPMKRTSNLEEYGVSKVSGGFFDSIKYYKPMILPDFYPVDEELDGYTIKFKNKMDLIRIIEGIITQPNKLHNLKRRLTSIYNKYSISNLQNRIKEEVLEFLE